MAQKGFKAFLGRMFLKFTGWTFEHGQVTHAKFVLIAAPHTSGWDLIYMLACASILGLKLHWIGKHTLFRWPLGHLLRKLGGIPVDRTKSNDMVEQCARILGERDSFVLAIPPSGTRSYRDYWKSGFYYIALRAGVPVLPAGLDWGKRKASLGEPMRLSGDVRADMDRIRAFYAGMIGKYPEKTSRIRLKAEDELRED